VSGQIQVTRSEIGALATAGADEFVAGEERRQRPACRGAVGVHPVDTELLAQPACFGAHLFDSRREVVERIVHVVRDESRGERRGAGERFEFGVFEEERAAVDEEQLRALAGADHAAVFLGRRRRDARDEEREAKRGGEQGDERRQATANRAWARRGGNQTGLTEIRSSWPSMFATLPASPVPSP